MEYTETLVETGIALATLAAKGTVSAVTKKIRAIKDEKNSEKIRTTYEEIINEILQEREEAVLIAQTYKNELDRIKISDDDIEHLHNTVARIIEIVKTMQLASAIGRDENEVKKIMAQVESFEQIKELISIDTLKAIQLLGFNFKAAIGEPLTQICAEKISLWGTGKQQKPSKKK